MEGGDRTFLASGQGKSRDLAVKLSAWELEPAVIDHLILLRPEADMMLVGKGKQAWQDMEKKEGIAGWSLLPWMVAHLFMRFQGF